MVGVVFHLNLRATQGFLESVLTMMSVQLPVPDWATMCRRQRGLNVQVRNPAQIFFDFVAVFATEDHGRGWRASIRTFEDTRGPRGVPLARW